ncbi:MAG: FUSC family protein [Chitinophagales bacterium]
MLARRLGLTHQVVKTALAAGLAWILATRISPSPFPYFAPLAVIVTYQATLADTMAQAVYRVVGILIGVAVSLMIGYWLQIGALAVTLVTLIGMAVPTALGLHRAIVTQVGVTALMVLAVRDPRPYALYRVLESALGALVGVAVNVLVVPNDIPLAEQRIAGLAELLATSLAGAVPAERGAERVSPEQLAARIERKTAEAYQALKSAQASGRLNPFLRSRGARLGRLAGALKTLEKVSIQVWGITLGLNELAGGGEAFALELTVVLQETAGCITAFARAKTEPAATSRDQLAGAVDRARRSQARFRALLVEAPALPALSYWGAVLTDLKRILAEVGGEAAGDATRIAIMTGEEWA